jgi:hypothetical protein
VRSYEEPRTHHPAPEFQDTGIAAVRRLHEALDADVVNTGQLSGARGAATATRRLPGTRRKLFKYFRDPSGWLTSTSTGSGGSGDSYRMYAGDYHREQWGDPDRIVPCNGEIECRIADAKSPAYVLATWTWRRLPPDRIAPRERDGRPGADLVPDAQPTLRFDLEPAGVDDGTPLTLVRVTHDQVPVEWVDDLAAYWAVPSQKNAVSRRWMLERADYDFDLSDARRGGYRN